MRTMDRKLWTKGYRYSGPRTIRTMCNRMHLHIVLVLLYTVCLSVSLAFSSFGCWGWGGGIMTSFHCFNTYVLRDNILEITERRCARKKKKKKKKKARGDTTCLPQIPPEKNNETGISGCGPFIIAYLRPAASIDR